MSKCHLISQKFGSQVTTRSYVTFIQRSVCEKLSKFYNFKKKLLFKNFYIFQMDKIITDKSDFNGEKTRWI